MCTLRFIVTKLNARKICTSTLNELEHIIRTRWHLLQKQIEIIFDLTRNQVN